MTVVQVAAGATPTQVVAAGNRDFIHIYNNSDALVFLCYDGDATTLATTNGWPLAAGSWYNLDNDGARNLFNKAIYAVHGGAGNKELRLQGA